MDASSKLSDIGDMGQALRRRDAARLRRLAIELLARGRTCADVAREIGVSRESVRQWKARYINAGQAGLDLHGKGRWVPMDRVETVLTRRLEERDDSRRRRRWTTVRLTEVVELEFGVRYSVGNMHGILKELGFRFIFGVGWRSPKKSPRPGPAPWGYRRDMKGALIPNDDERRIACIVRHMHVTGFSMEWIVTYLRDAAGVVGRTGRPISKTRVFEMIHGARKRPSMGQ